jgi:hypothetical protein
MLKPPTLDFLRGGIQERARAQVRAAARPDVVAKDDRLQITHGSPDALYRASSDPAS